MSRQLFHKIQRKELLFHEVIVHPSSFRSDRRLCIRCNKLVYANAVGQLVEYHYNKKQLVEAPAIEVVRQESKHVCCC
jgi:hypothetical protein